MTAPHHPPADHTDDDARPDSPRRPMLDLSLTQLLGGALAAATGAALVARLGVAGTILGAAAISRMSVIGGAAYTHLLRHTRARVRSAAERTSVREVPPRPGRPWGRRGAGRSARRRPRPVAEPTAARPPPSGTQCPGRCLCCLRSRVRGHHRARVARRRASPGPPAGPRSAPPSPRATTRTPAPQTRPHQCRSIQPDAPSPATLSSSRRRPAPRRSIAFPRQAPARRAADRQRAPHPRRASRPAAPRRPPSAVTSSPWVRRCPRSHRTRARICTTRP